MRQHFGMEGAGWEGNTNGQVDINCATETDEDAGHADEWPVPAAWTIAHASLPHAIMPAASAAVCVCACVLVCVCVCVEVGGKLAEADCEGDGVAAAMRRGMPVGSAATDGGGCGGSVAIGRRKRAGTMRQRGQKESGPRNGQ